MYIYIYYIYRYMYVCVYIYICIHVYTCDMYMPDVCICIHLYIEAGLPVLEAGPLDLPVGSEPARGEGHSLVELRVVAFFPVRCMYVYIYIYI